MSLPPPLIALLTAVRDVDAPAFTTLFAKLTDTLEALDLATLDPADRTTLMAHLDSLTTHFATQKDDASRQLGNLRTGAALNAYKNPMK